MPKRTKRKEEIQVSLVELPPRQFGILNGKPSLDVYSKFSLPSRAIQTLQAILIADGFTNTHHINPDYHGDRGKLTNRNFKTIFDSDILLESALTRTMPQSLELAGKYKSAKPDGVVVFGGPGPTFQIEESLQKADIVVIKEGEKTISELMKRLIQDPKNLDDIDGIAFKRNKEIIVTNPRKLLTSEELSQLPHPYYDSVMQQKIRTGTIETSRGCPNNCDFCTVTKVYGRKYRTKSIEYVIEELEYLKNIKRALFFKDDNLIGSPQRTIALLEEIADRGLNNRFGIAQTTVKAAKNPEIIESIKKAGIRVLCIGIESINNETLKALGKPYKAEENIEAIKILRQNGFWIHGMMMPGGEGDTAKSLREDFKWVNENLDSVQFSSPTPFPGTKFYREMKKQGRILTDDKYLYDGQNVVIRPKHLTPYELQIMNQKAYQDFYSFRNQAKRFTKSPQKKVTLGIMFYTQTGGIINFIKSPQYQTYLEFLKSKS